MKRFVNGTEVELEASGAQIVKTADRLIVKNHGESYSALSVRQGNTTFVSYKGRTYKVEQAARTGKRGGGASSGETRAPMPGLIVDVLVEVGQAVSKGDKLVVLEAMKTQQAFTAGFDGVVASVDVVKGDQVVDGQLLVGLKAAE